MQNKIVLNLAVSLDGFIADEHGGYDWIKPSGKKQLNTHSMWSHEKFLKRISAVVMGKACYDQLLHIDYADKDVYVITSKELVDHGNIHFIHSDICRQITELKEQADGDIYLFGGGKSIDPILKAGLIDEYIIGIIPIILGKGIPLFRPDNPTIPLTLTNDYVANGIVILRYIPRVQGADKPVNKDTTTDATGND